MSKDVANTPDTGDELCFTVNNDGGVEFSKNGSPPQTFMHVDVSIPLWVFWDVYGNTQKLRLVGGTNENIRQPGDNDASQENDRNNLTMTDAVGISNNTIPSQPSRSRSTHNIGIQSQSSNSQSNRYLQIQMISYYFKDP